MSDTPNDSHHIEELVLQQRLMENLARARLYGDTQTSKAERIQIVETLVHLKHERETCGSEVPEFGRFARSAEGEVVFVHPGSEPTIIGTTMEELQAKLQAARQTKDLATVGKALLNLGLAYEAQPDFHQATAHYRQAVVIARELGDQQAEAISLYYLALAFLRLTDDEPDQRSTHLSSAVDALRQATEILDNLDMYPLLLARVRYHLGRCYHQLGHWREAITMLEQAREIFSRHKARPELAHTLLELGQLYQLTQDFESADTYLKDALRLFRRMNDADGIAVTQEALGNLALQTARPKEAIVSLKEARRGYTTLGRKDRVHAVDELLHIAQQARQPVMGRGATP